MESPRTLEQQELGVRLGLPPDASPPRHKRHWWLWVVVLGVLAFAAWHYRGVFATRDAASNAAAGRARLANHPVPVVVATAERRDMPVYLTGLGSAAAFNTVTVRSRVDGQLVNAAFREGQFVHQGDELAEIDPRPFQVQLEQAQGQLARDTAQLNDARAILARDQALFKDQIIPQQQLDTQQATVAQYAGALESDKAQIDNAKLQLTYCHITAPLSGRIGLRLVDPGNIIHAADPNGLAVITQLQPIAVLFSLPQDNLPVVYSKIRAGAKLPVDAYDRDNTTKLASGTLLTIDNQIDPQTGTYKLKAVFPNENNLLFPNQFVNVRLLVDVRRGLTAVPSAAVSHGPQGDYVYAVESGVARVRPVTIALSDSSRVALSAGLVPGDSVVIDGQDKLQDGTKVTAREGHAGAGLRTAAGAAAPAQPGATALPNAPAARGRGRTPGAQGHRP